MQVAAGTARIIKLSVFMALLQAAFLVFNIFIAKDYNLYILSVSFGMGLFVLAALASRYLRNNIPTQSSITISAQKYFKLKIMIILLLVAWALMQIIIYLSVSVWAFALGFTGYYRLDVFMQIGTSIVAVTLSLFFAFMPIKKTS